MNLSPELCCGLRSLFVRLKVFRFALFQLLVLVLLAAASIQARAQTTFNLTAGWNLLGNSSSSPINVTTTFADAATITTVWKWNKATSRWAFYAPSMTSSALTTYVLGKGYDVLTSVDPKEGFWVNASAALALTGPVANGLTLVESDLQPGWNLVGSADSANPSQLNQSLGGSLNAAGKAMVTAWAWDAPSAKWRFNAPALEAQGVTVLADYVAKKGYLPFSAALSASDGLWLNIGTVTPTPATVDFPVNELFAASLIGKGMPADFARFFAAAKLSANCTGTATCTYLQTYPNGATREVAWTATPNQQYTPTAAEFVSKVLVSNPVYDGKFAVIGIEDSTPPVDTKIDIGYFVPTTSIPTNPAILSSAMSSALSMTLRAVSRAQTGAPSLTDGIRLNLTEIGKKGVDAGIGGALDHYNLGKTGNVYKIASVASDLATALKLGVDANAWLTELANLEKCAANPTNTLTQTDPTYVATTAARLQAIRAEIVANSSVRLLNVVDETAEGFVSGTAMAVLSIPLKQGHEYTEQTLKDVSENLMHEARSSVVSCAPTAPTGLVVTAASETQLDLSWSGSIATVTDVGTWYKISGGGAAGNPTFSTTWSDTGLAPSTTHCYTVSAYNAYGTSPDSAQACGTTLGPPVVHGTNPFGGELNVVVNSAITVTFSEAMDPATITTGTFALSSPDGPVAGAVAYGGLTATFTPSAALAYATTYTATIATGVKDLSGVPMTQSYTWSFTTEPAPTTGNLQFVQTGTDGSVSGTANITWNLLESLSDLNMYYATGTITADITRAECDPVHVTKSIEPKSGTGDGGHLAVYNSSNTALPNQYEFTVLSVLWSQTFQCGNPRQPITYPSYYMNVSVGLCLSGNVYPRFTDATHLAGANFTCDTAVGGYIFGNQSATWDFTGSIK